MGNALFDAIVSLCFPLLLLAGAIWVAATLSDGENPLAVILDMFGLLKHKMPGPTTIEEYAAELVGDTDYQIYQPNPPTLNDELDEIRDQKRLAEIHYCVFAGIEKIIEQEIKASARYRGK